jgi:hypothetical protein
MHDALEKDAPDPYDGNFSIVAHFRLLGKRASYIYFLVVFPMSETRRPLPSAKYAKGNFYLILYVVCSMSLGI